MTPLHMACVLGTRPEAIKLAPIVALARRQPDRFTVTVVATGQHRDMADAALAEFGLASEIDLNAMEPNQRPTDVIARVLLHLAPVFDRIRPDVVLVQGDTASVLAGALAAHHARIPVGHVEAGLRTDDRYSPFPEEMNRRLVSVLSTFHFAPTQLARHRLLAEVANPESILVTGNTVVDSLFMLRASAVPPAGVTIPASARLILLTCHRRENHGEKLTEILRAVRDIVEARPDVVVVCPVHPNPAVQTRVRQDLGAVPRVTLVDPLGYSELLWLLDRSTLVLTDSGGLQEEAPALHKPVLVLRDVTERPEGLDAGVAQLVGTARGAIVRQTLRLLDDQDTYRRMANGVNPYGDGCASERILNFLFEHMQCQTVSSSAAVVPR